MKKSIQGFFSRFRKKNQDPTAPRTSADSQLEDMQKPDSLTEEEKAFSEKTYKQSQKENRGENPFRE